MGRGAPAVPAARQWNPVTTRASPTSRVLPPPRCRPAAAPRSTISTTTSRFKRHSASSQYGRACAEDLGVEQAGERLIHVEAQPDDVSYHGLATTRDQGPVPWRISAGTRS